MPLFSTHTFTIPYSNPFPMFRLSSGKRVYSHFDDKRNAVQGRSYTQVWKSTDMLSFQCSWTGIVASDNQNVKFKIFVDGTATVTSTKAITTEGYVGTPYNDFAFNMANGNGSLNGVYVFSKRISDFTSTGHCIKIQVTDPDGNIWESDEMVVNDSVTGTKLIHYSQTCKAYETIFDTYFGMMVYGYDIRLHGKYTGSESVMESEKMSGSDGGMLMINATPIWKTNIELGIDGVGFPSYYLMLMTMVAACDTKTMDDYGAFELDGADFQRQTFNDYDNGFYSTPIRLKNNKFGQTLSGPRKIQVFVENYKTETNENIAVVTVENNGGRWYIDKDVMADGVKDIDTITGGDGNTKVKIKFSYTDTEETNTINIKDAETDTVIATFTLVNPATRLGLNHMAIGDTFIITGEARKESRTATKKFS